MHLEWRNGFLRVGPDMMRYGWSVQLCWNRREHLNDIPCEGELIFADEITLTWVQGKLKPYRSRRSTLSHFRNI